jgi:hypothetical protein
VEAATEVAREVKNEATVGVVEVVDPEEAEVVTLAQDQKAAIVDHHSILKIKFTSLDLARG